MPKNSTHRAIYLGTFFTVLLSLSACSIAPEPVAPTLAPQSNTQDILLGPVVVIGDGDGGDGGGSGGGGFGGGFGGSSGGGFGGGGGYSGGGSSGGGDGSGGGGNSAPSAPGATTTIISANLQPCAKDLLVNLQNLNGNDIGRLFDYFKNSTSTTWNVQNAYIPNVDGRQINGLTSQSDGMPSDFLTTTLNTTFLNNATDVAVSRTLIHESLHAYLIRWGYSRGMSINSTMNQLVDGYLGSLSPNNIDSQHDAMANIINQMAGALQSKFPTLNLTYAQNLFWAGLTGTSAYTSLSNAQKAAIVSAETAEVYNQSSAVGSKACK